MKHGYSTNVTDKQWAIIKPLFIELHHRGCRLCKHSGSDMLNAISILLEQVVSGVSYLVDMTGEKKIKGRKRDIFVDTLDLIHRLKIHEANIQDRDGAV